jgi:translation initiation factor IF-3
VKFSVRVSDHDYGYRVEQVKRFLAKKHSVLAVVQFKGREITHPELGQELLARLLTDLGRNGTPVLKGRSLQVLITPKS